MVDNTHSQKKDWLQKYWEINQQNCKFQTNFRRNATFIESNKTNVHFRLFIIIDEPDVDDILFWNSTLS